MRGSTPNGWCRRGCPGTWRRRRVRRRWRGRAPWPSKLPWTTARPSTSGTPQQAQGRRLRPRTRSRCLRKRAARPTTILPRSLRRHHPAHKGTSRRRPPLAMPRRTNSPLSWSGKRRLLTLPRTNSPGWREIQQLPIWRRRRVIRHRQIRTVRIRQLTLTRQPPPKTPPQLCWKTRPPPSRTRPPRTRTRPWIRPRSSRSQRTETAPPWTRSPVSPTRRPPQTTRRRRGSTCGGGRCAPSVTASRPCTAPTPPAAGAACRWAHRDASATVASLVLQMYIKWKGQAAAAAGVPRRR
mmetsp:Transcript_25502/g.82400  ORF Transcript_25502/g.82400 Transcript_25502/m.82400 type:complete len:295 (+) Transcript_25502:1523-2407(+)